MKGSVPRPKPHVRAKVGRSRRGSQANGEMHRVCRRDSWLTAGQGGRRESDPSRSPARWGCPVGSPANTIRCAPALLAATPPGAESCTRSGALCADGAGETRQACSGVWMATPDRDDPSQYTVWPPAARKASEAVDFLAVANRLYRNREALFLVRDGESRLRLVEAAPEVGGETAATGGLGSRIRGKRPTQLPIERTAIQVEYRLDEIGEDLGSRPEGKSVGEEGDAQADRRSPPGERCEGGEEQPPEKVYDRGIERPAGSGELRLCAGRQEEPEVGPDGDRVEPVLVAGSRFRGP